MNAPPMQQQSEPLILAYGVKENQGARIAPRRIERKVFSRARAFSEGKPRRLAYGDSQPRYAGIYLLTKLSIK